MHTINLFLATAFVISAQSIPSEMVGTWTSSEVRTTQFRDRAGASARPSGAIIKYRISADGQYREDTLIQTSMYNCTDVVSVAETGTVRVDGASLIFESSGAHLTSQDNCNARFNYSK